MTEHSLLAPPLHSEEALENLDFESALKELERVVRHLEEGDVSLEKAIQAYERGASLKSYCDLLLKEAKIKIDQIITEDAGTITTKPFERT